MSHRPVRKNIVAAWRASACSTCSGNDLQNRKSRPHFSASRPSFDHSENGSCCLHRRQLGARKFEHFCVFSGEEIHHFRKNHVCKIASTATTKLIAWLASENIPFLKNELNSSVKYFRFALILKLKKKDWRRFFSFFISECLRLVVVVASRKFASFRVS